MKTTNVYVIVGIFGGINLILTIFFGAFLPVFYVNMGEIANTTITNPNLHAMYDNFLFGNLARVFGVVAVCSFIGLFVFMILNSFRREPEEQWEEV